MCCISLHLYSLGFRSHNPYFGQRSMFSLCHQAGQAMFNRTGVGQNGTRVDIHILLTLCKAILAVPSPTVAGSHLYIYIYIFIPAWKDV